MFDSLPVFARKDAWERWQWLRDAGAVLPDDARVRETLPQVLAYSRFVADVLRCQPEMLGGEWAADLARPFMPAEIRTAVVQAVSSASNEQELMRELRRVRHRMLARIAWRDIVGWADETDTLVALCSLADACIDAALAHVHDDMRLRHGELRNAEGRPQRLIVLGMGKLGGGELNFSSDIDLIFAYAEGGESDGAKPLDAERYFTKLGQRLIRVLDEATENGFVYRVDMRLRPFGESGPLAMSFAALETYYQRHGREWERYAFVKARPVAGDIAAGDELLEMLRPFVYRRYLDYGVFESLRDIKESINREVLRREYRSHIKLGPGGIREAEFIVQLFQLVRGGREPAMRARGFRDALRAVRAGGSLDADEAEALGAAYGFLRRLENRLQEKEDRQTHQLPDARTELELLAWSLGFSGVAEFEAELSRHRETVSDLFNATFLGPAAEEEHHPLDTVWRDHAAAAEEALHAAGFDSPEAVEKLLAPLRGLIERQRPGARGVQRLRQLLPRLIEAAGKQAEPETALQRMLQVIEAVIRRTTYLALLVENPQALRQLARVCGASGWIARLVARHPVLLDELIDPRLFDTAPSHEDAEQELRQLLAMQPPDDLEAVMDALREFQQLSVMRIAAADISGVLPLMHVSDCLTGVAEIIIRAVLELARSHLIQRHGRPRYQTNSQSCDAEFLVVAYGKLGGLELGYGSDLDLVFMHNSRGEAQQTDGDKPVENSVFFLRLAQRLIHFLSTPTSAGVLYEVDTRLRPSGKGGLLVTSLDAFDKYQQEVAWTWEHQALLRARPVAGNAELAAAFNAVRRSILGQHRDGEALRQEVADMRVRMLRELGVDPGHIDLKGSPGGITDIEFLAQYWVLRHAPDYPDLLTFTDTIRFLEGLESCACVASATIDTLVEAYRELRAVVHARSLQGQSAVVPESLCGEARERVSRIWQTVFGDLSPA